MLLSPGRHGSLEGYTRATGLVHRTTRTTHRDRRQRTRTERQVTQPSSFSNSEISTVSTW
ncbi:hypothetical protein B0H03_104264 [Rathayibacter iranicus NCPPB 2253 = VKM Ac-1602]|uniref:Uncharacterized protein n=1 Tax=Rathayibacter iranicus NCPPB 2253 = VKM Ac-1602 TaxID=1328868 RepID=A0ABX5LFE0_9MICO|nr:hypothetical protein B0H03_104264 [Rathayibacter iranicus NCPPB 2253 = VKM Ac-1602]